MSTGPLKAPGSSTGEIAHIGSSVFIKGELSGNEDVYLDGEVEGGIELRDFALTVGPKGRVRANIHAKTVVVQGKVEGDISADHRVELRKSAMVTGNIHAQRLTIEDGALIAGKVEMVQAAPSPEKTERSKAGAAAPTLSSTVPVAPAATPAQALQPEKA